MIICEGCGTANEEGAAYCTKCARKLDAETQQAVAVKRAEHTTTGTRWTAVVVAGLLVLVVIVVIVLFVTGVL